MKRYEKSVERRLYEAFRARRGCFLTRQEVDDLLRLDDAIQTRICNAAAIEQDRPEAGVVLLGFGNKTWHELKQEVPR